LPTDTQLRFCYFSEITGNEAVPEATGSEFVGLGMRDGIFSGGVMGALVTLSVTGAVHWLRLQRSLERPRKKAHSRGAQMHGPAHQVKVKSVHWMM
jgi:hypothetical protein